MGGNHRADPNSSIVIGRKNADFGTDLLLGNWTERLTQEGLSPILQSRSWSDLAWQQNLGSVVSVPANWLWGRFYFMERVASPSQRLLIDNLALCL